MATTGAGYFWQGVKLLRQPGIRAFVIVPVLINLLLFAALTAVLVAQFDTLLNWLVAQLGGWLEWLRWLLWLIAGIFWLVFYGYGFTLISTLIAAPFYGLLAERVELHLTGKAASEPLTLTGLLVLAHRTLVREVRKLLYFLPRFLGVVLLSLILSFVPGLGLLAPVLYFLWGAWSLALQHADYAADNNGVTFAALRDRCARRRGTSLSFGALAMLSASVPLLNLLAVPAAVAGATALWVERLDSGAG
ncbi:MAG: sulfate transporter CysZ [Porticoccaceae bacterium]|jgi:CysZ protein